MAEVNDKVDVGDLQETARTSPHSLALSVDVGKNMFGFRELKKQQQAAIEGILCGRDVFVSLPTGFGKSLIYHLLPVCAHDLAVRNMNASGYHPFVLVVSPLISLIQDQVSILQQKGFKALYIRERKPDSGDSYPDLKAYKYVFASPEVLLGVKKWRQFVLSDSFRNNVVALVIDEAHCIAKWGMGEAFREWYGHIGQLRSLLHSSTPVVALTATATTIVRNKIVSRLQMDGCDTIQVAPNRPNVRYSVLNVNNDLECSFSWLICDLKKERTLLPRVVIFCQSLHTCASLYKLFIVSLQEESYEPVGSTPSIFCRLFAMYHSKIDDSDKEVILKSLKQENGICRVLFCTIAFGMGVDIPNIRTVIHYGPSSDIDDYVQESGRAGRDGELSNAVIYKYPASLLGHVSAAMKDYVKLEKGCRRIFLLKQFTSEGVQSTPIKHLCCDLCASECECEETCPFKTQQVKTTPIVGVHDDHDSVRQVSDEDRSILQTKLLEFRSMLLSSVHNTEGTIPLYVGEDLACGLSEPIISSIVDNCHVINSVNDLEEKCLIFGHGRQIMDIIESVIT